MNEGWMKNDEEWMIKDDISSCWGVLTYDRRMDERMDIFDCRVAFATEKTEKSDKENNIFICCHIQSY